MGPRLKGLNRSQENWVEYVKSRLSTSNRGDVIDLPGKKNATRQISSFTDTFKKSQGPTNKTFLANCKED